MTEERLALLTAALHENPSALHENPSALHSLSQEKGVTGWVTGGAEVYAYIAKELCAEVHRLRDAWVTEEKLDHIIDLLSQCKEVAYAIRDREYTPQPTCPYITTSDEGTNYCTLGAPPTTVTFEGFPCEGIFKVWYPDSNPEKVGSPGNFACIGGLPEPDPMALARVMVNKDWLLDHLRAALDGGHCLNDVADLLLQAARQEIEKGEKERCP